MALPLTLELIANLVERAGMSMASKLTGIRPWRIESYLTGAISPVTSTLHKFQSAYRLANYAVLRDAGFSVTQSARFRDALPSQVNKMIGTIDSVVQSSAIRAGAALADVTAGYRMSDYTWEDILGLEGKDYS